MTKRKKSALIAVSIIAITNIVIVRVYFIFPRTVLKYRSNDGKVNILITQSQEFKPVPLRVQEYTLIVKRKERILSKTLLKTDFRFYADCAIIADCFVDVEWYDNSVTVTIDSNEMYEKKYNVSW